MTIDVTCQPVNDFRGADRLATLNLTLDPFNREALMAYQD